MRVIGYCRALLKRSGKTIRCTLSFLFSLPVAVLLLNHFFSEQIEAKHQKLREALRGQARKRHREASKRSRKIGKGKRTRGDDL